MKRIRKLGLLFLASLLLLNFSALAQDNTSFDYQFESGAEGNFNAGWAGSFSKSYADGDMIVTFDKSANPWDRIVLWAKPFDISVAPFFKCYVKSPDAFTLRIDFKDEAGKSIVTNTNLTGGDNWDEIILDLRNWADVLDSKIIAEVQFAPSINVGSMTFEYVQFGEAAQPNWNFPPTIDQPNDFAGYPDNGQQTIELTGISDGNGATQNISISAATDNDGLFTDYSVTMTSASTADFTFTPEGSLGNADVTITLKDDGGTTDPNDVDTKEVTFNVAMVERMTYFTDDFNFGLAHQWTEVPGYTLTGVDEQLVVDVNKNTGEYNRYFSLDFDLVRDISSAPYISFKAKTEATCVLYVYIEDLAGKKVSQKVRLLEGGFSDVTLDFTALGTIDLTQIKSVHFNYHEKSYSYSGKNYIEDFKLGTEAAKSAGIMPIADRVYHKNAKGKSIFLTDIRHAASITLDHSGSLIENVTEGTISNNAATISFDCINDQSGSEMITVTAVGENGYANSTAQFLLTIEDDMVPTIDPVDNMNAQTSEMLYVKLSGITDGNSGIEQAISITAMSNNVGQLPHPEVMYDGRSPHAMLTLSPAMAGSPEVTITVKDAGMSNNTTTETFTVDIYDNVNHAPTIDPVKNFSVYDDAGQVTVSLTGISDGDAGTESLSFTVVSNKTGVIPTPAVSYTGGSTAELTFTPTGTIDMATIDLTILDDGGTIDNNGNQSTTISFDVEVIARPVDGHTADFTGNITDDLNDDIWTLHDGQGGKYTVAYETFDASDCIKIDCDDKWLWDGYNYNFDNLDFELDLSEHQYMSMEVYSVDKATMHWVWFYDANGERHNQNNTAKRVWAPAGEWTKMVFDFSGENDWLNTDNGEDIDNTRIVRCLFNLHDAEINYPVPPNYTGTFYIRNLKFGSHADIPPVPVKPTIDPVADVAVFKNSGSTEISLTGITDGVSSTNNITITATSSDVNILAHPTVSSVNTEGEATLNFNATDDNSGTVTVTLTISADAADQDQMETFTVDLLSKTLVDMTEVTIDRSEKHQTIYGFGSFYDTKFAQPYTEEMKATAVRIGLINNQIEPINDNDDPYVLDMTKLNYDAFDFEYFKALKAGGVETFILTSWSPPAWMKDNLSMSHFSAGVDVNNDNTDNKLSYHYYEEFAEEMVAVVRMFKEEADIDLEAIGIQNEPVFHEPYPSGILDTKKFPELIKVVAQRFEQEGISTRLYMPEQVFSQGSNSMAQYINDLQASDANQYCDIIATHGYASDGIGSGAPNFTQWTNMWNNAQEGDYPKELWMTETHRGYNDFDDAMFIAAAIQGALVNGNVSLWTQWAFEGQFYAQGSPSQMLYAMRNFSEFVRPGAVRITTTSSENNVLVSAFEDPEEETVSIVMVNLGDNATGVNITGSNLPSTYTAYRTTAYESCEMLGEMSLVDDVALPARSVLTLYAHQTTEPTIDALENTRISKNANQQNIELTGISNGEGSTDNLNLAVATDNPALFSELTVGSVSGSGTSTLDFTPANDQVGSAKVMLTLTDNNTSNTKEIAFYVTVLDLKMNDVEDQNIELGTGRATIEVTGIDNGLGNIEWLTLDAESDNANFTLKGSISIDEDGTSTIRFDLPDAVESTNITLTLSDGQGNELQQTFAINITTDVAELSSQGIRLYPNPTQDKLHLNLPVDNKYHTIAIQDLTGRNLINKQIEPDALRETIDVSQLAKGLYIISLKGDKHTLTGRFIVE